MVTWPMVNARELHLSPAGVLWLKLGACLAMVIDHVDWLLLDGALHFHDTLGRVVFPVFAYVLAGNLVRAEPSHMLRRVAPRMLLAGVVAQLPYGYLVEWSGPLNVMFTLALAVAIVSWWNLGHRARAGLAFLVLGGLVDYQWFGVALVALFAWGLERRTFPHWAYGVAAAVLLLPINGNAWAVLLPLAIAVAGVVQGQAPRLKWLFYAFYPLHLFVLAATV